MTFSFYNPMPLSMRWIKRIVVWHIGIFVIAKVIHIWFGLDLLTRLLGLTPLALTHCQIWRLITYSFLHGNFWHIFFNLLLFYSLSRFLLMYELRLKALLCLYFSGIFCGGLTWACLHLSSPYVTLVGLSAGVATLLTYFCLLYPEKSMTLLLFFILPINLKAIWLLYLFLAYEIFCFLTYELASMTTIAHSAHLAGALVGVIAVFLQKRRERTSEQKFTKKSTYQVHIESHNVVENVPFNILKKLQDQGLESLSMDERKWLENYRKL